MKKTHKLNNIDFKRDGIQLKVDMGRIEQNLNHAQFALDSQIMTDMVPYMPMQTGNFINVTRAMSAALAGSGKVVAAAPPYGQYLYEGKVMVDSKTGKGPMKIPDGPGGAYVLRFRKGAKLEATTRKLQFSKAAHPKAQAHWFEAAKKVNKGTWVEIAKREVGKG